MKIIRFNQHGPNKVIATGLSLEEAQAHCQRDDTHGEGWFDGYEDEDEDRDLEAEAMREAEHRTAIIKINDLLR